MTNDRRAAEMRRMIGQFEVEALGEAQWLHHVTGTPESDTREMAATAMERAAQQLRQRGKP